MANEKRIRKPVEKFKPDNFKDKPKQPRQARQPRQPTQPTQQAAQKNNAKGLNKAYRVVEAYKALKIIDDSISQAYENSLKLLDFNQFTDQTKAFTIWDKVHLMVDSINPYINGPNSWTNGIYN